VIKRLRPKSATYSVGYGRPPKETQFKPGTSGNAKGRPKGTRPIGAILQDIIQQKISVTEGGKTRRITTLEVMFRRLANDAMRSDQKAIKLLLSLADRYAGSPETVLQLREMLNEDEEILAQYLREPIGSPEPSTPARDEERNDDGL
jgi:hypothetical protein